MTTNASFWLMVFLHLHLDTTEWEVPSVKLQTHKQVGVSKCLQFFGFSNHNLWETLHIFSSVWSTQMVTILRQSIVTWRFSPVVPPLPLLIWTLSRRITARPEPCGFLHDMLKILLSSCKLWQKQKFSLRRVKLLEQIHFHWPLNTYGKRLRGSFLSARSSPLSISASCTDPGFNQPPLSDGELSDVVDWDQLSSMADDNDDSSSPGPICPLTDWEAVEEVPVDVPASKRNRKWACFSEGSETDETVA